METYATHPRRPSSANALLRGSRRLRGEKTSPKNAAVDVSSLSIPPTHRDIDRVFEHFTRLGLEQREVSAVTSGAFKNEPSIGSVVGQFI